MKRLLSLLSLLVITLSLFAEEFVVDGIRYSTTSSNTVEVISNNYSGDVLIPENIESNSIIYSVTSIGDVAFWFCSGLTSVTIPNSVTSIGEEAFGYCSGLTSVTIPNNVTSIGDYAFESCSGLTSVTIGNNVTSIGVNAFSGCSGLTSVTIPNSVTSIGMGAFFQCSGLTSIVVENGNPIYNSRYGCNAIIETSSNTLLFGCKSTIIPNSVTSIMSHAFDSCSGLTSVTIPNSVTSIGLEAFTSCSGLTSIVVENGNPIYDSRYGCNAIIETSSNTLLSGCKSTIIPNSVTSIGLGAFFGCSGLSSVTIPNSVTSIGKEAFGYCRGLTSVTIPNSVTSIGDYAFKSCSGLTSVGLSNNLTEISRNAFQDCISLKSIIVPNSVTVINSNAFNGCSSLTIVIVGNEVNKIDYTSFANCKELTDFYCYADNVPKTMEDAFYKSFIEYATLHVPASLIETYKITKPWSEFGKIVALTDSDPKPTAIATVTMVDDNNIKYYTIDGKSISKPQKGINILKYSDGTTKKVVIR